MIETPYSIRCHREPTTAPATETGYTVYIAGPISCGGDLAENLQAFFDAERELRAAGYATVNPARGDGGINGKDAAKLADAAGISWTEYMRRGIDSLVTKCDAIALLPCWWFSAGASLENRIASALGMAKIKHDTGEVIFVPTGPQNTIPADCLF